MNVVAAISRLDPNRWGSDLRNAGMVSTANEIVVACVAVAVTLWLAIVGIESVPDRAAFGVLLGVGVLLPGILTRRYA